MAAEKNLLVELFVEELPPKALKTLGDEFAEGLAEGLRKAGLMAQDARVTAYASPRRLAAHLTGVSGKAADRTATQKLMPASVGLDASGNLTRALMKKLQSLGADASAAARLKRESDGKNEVLFLDSTVAGATLAEGLQKALDGALAKLPIPKVMSYQLDDGWTTVEFVRPAHGLVALHGDEVVPVRILGLDAGRTTRGHRFEASADPIVLKDADNYALQLETEGAVIASFADRRAEIQRQLADAATAQGLTPIADDALLDEVTALVERPNVLACEFDAEFLDVPQEVLILTMKANQKYFPLLDAQGKLTNRFLLVSNIRPADPSRVIEGNERVVRPRLADAKFFFDQDRKKTLESRVEGLSKVVYHNKLGTQRERTERVRAIAREIGLRLGGEPLAQKADRAALLAKADLLTDMVGEFPELQGTMGRYYAIHDGLDAEIADAIEDHYKPRFAGDELPRGKVGMVLALADKLETLVGMFGIGQVPTGDKDPFALRRHALGVIRMLIDNELPLSLDARLDAAARAFAGRPGFDDRRATVESKDFIEDRLAGMLRDQGYSAQEVDAVISLHPQVFREIPKRLAAVRAFAALPEAASLAAANKRVGNILKKEGVFEGHAEPALLNEPAERELHAALSALGPRAEAAFDRGDYAESLRVLAGLKNPVDTFFDSVMVNADDPPTRVNRLGLLVQLHAAMNRVADLSKLAV